ncbi:aaa atpase domain-containing protein [Tupanvirus deep ocean]|uniref:Aaa atpase domain-containing protein n=2 Tax=Tupanvirus TaxID=2094720 RepID=A0AC62A7M3_9VIRU|nr:aaa atpase domain-containing protein [Tupanvirus deep ocean]QKU33675.1 aaa atpase domain-containing protein [Tupanvirus deep ocean]
MQTFRYKLTTDDFLIEKYVNHLRTDGNEYVYAGYTKDENNDIELKLLIPKGHTKIIYKGYEFEFEVIVYDDIHGLRDNTTKHEELYLTIFCESKEKSHNLLKSFINDAEDFCKSKNNNAIQMYIFSAGRGWILLSKLKKRNMDTIYLPKKIKSKIIRDIEEFYKSGDEYKKHGIPYTKKYLFHGPIATGKSSFIFALASYFSKNISMISFNNFLDDALLMSCVKGLDGDTILVLEDIDLLFVSKHERSETNNSLVSFNGLLNILDGFGRKEGLVIFMTTTNIGLLEGSLVRPGRIDDIITFETPNKKIVKEMYFDFFPSQKSMFKEFYEKISQYKLSIPMLQKFFFENRRCDNIINVIPEYSELVKLYPKENSSVLYN